MTARFASDNLDLSRLPPPEVVRGVNFETILAERLARFKELWPDYDMDQIETDPVMILEQVAAYRETLGYAAINDAARALMLAFSTGSDLDHLGAFYGVVRHLLRPASQGVTALYESDDDFRRRIQLAPEALPYAGMTGGGYRSLALKTAPSLKDVTTVKRGGGRVDVVLLAREGDGMVDDEVVNTVYAAFKDDAATQLTDIISVRAAEIVDYTVNLNLVLRPGPDPAVVVAASRAAVQAYVDSRHRVGQTVYVNGIVAAAKVGGVEDVELAAPVANIVPEPQGAPYCSAITITYEVLE
jgi:phage-related baseplate assembly protein